MTKFTSHTIPTKIVATLMLIQGILGCVLFSIMAFQNSQNLLTLAFITFMLFIAVLGLVSSIYLFRKTYWTLYAAVVFFILQLVSISNTDFSWTFNIGIEIGTYFNIGETEVGIDIYALIMLTLVAVSFTQVRSQNET